MVEGGAVARIGLGETTPNPLCGGGVGAVWGEVAGMDEGGANKGA